MGAKLRLRERVERWGNGSEGRSAGGEPILPAGIGQCQGVGGSCGTGGAEGDKRPSMGGRRKTLSLLQGSSLLWEGDDDTAPLCSILSTCSPGPAAVGRVVSSGTTLPLFFGVEGTCHLKTEEKKTPILGRVRFKKISKKSRVN